MMATYGNQNAARTALKTQSDLVRTSLRPGYSSRQLIETSCKASWCERGKLFTAFEPSREPEASRATAAEAFNNSCVNSMMEV
jgi:hypothetical protein